MRRRKPRKKKIQREDRKLLRALKAVVRMVFAMSDDDDQTRRDIPELVAAEAAIAKAEGKRVPRG